MKKTGKLSTMISCAFSLSVFLIYLVYGLIIIKFFQIIQFLTSVRLMIYKILSIFAIILGLLQVKDFFFYSPGGFLTEMPKSWRPKVQKILSGITSPKGEVSIQIKNKFRKNLLNIMIGLIDMEDIVMSY